MYFYVFYTLLVVSCLRAQVLYENDVNFRIEPGSRTCFFEKAKVGQMMEAWYQVIDGQHGDLDISFDILDPQGIKIVSDYKKSQNSIIMDIEYDGEYVFCMDNTFSVMNSKLVFVYVLIEDKDAKSNGTTTEATLDGKPKEEEILEWTGINEAGQPYYIEVKDITESLMRTLKHVVKARHQLDLYGATKSRDSYLAFEDTFIVDMWSGLQISIMFVVGMVQVYMIKKLFDRPVHSLECLH